MLKVDLHLSCKIYYRTLWYSRIFQVILARTIVYYQGSDLPFVYTGFTLYNILNYND